MATKPTTLPEWASDGSADVVEPSLGQKQDGWDVSDRPPAGWWNWWMKLVWNWMQYLNDAVFTTATTNGTCVTATGNGSGAGGNFTGGATGHGVVGAGGATSGNGGMFQGAGTNSGVVGLGQVGQNAKGGNFTGRGTASGVLGTSGETDGSYGVEGQVASAATNGGGVIGTGKGTGAGVTGVGIDGPGLIAQSDTTSPAKAALRIVPQDTAPATSPAAGDHFVDTVTNGLQSYNPDWSGWQRNIAQSFCQPVGEARTTSGEFTTHNISIPANSLRVGSTVRIRSWGRISAYTSGNVTVRLDVTGSGGATNFLGGTFATPSTSSRWYFEYTFTVTTLGAGGTLGGGGYTMIDIVAPSSIQSNSGFDTTVTFQLVPAVTISNTATVRCDGTVVDIT